MERISNITYNFDGEPVDSKEFIRLLCESIKLIMDLNNIKQA